MRDEIINSLTELSLKAMLYEVTTSPKPGLVDALDCGAHKDMDIYTFIDSSLTIKKPIKKAAEISYDNPDMDLKNLFLELKAIGIKAEKEMLKETSGVNTQKGIIFIFLIIISLAARHLSLYKHIELESLREDIKIMLSGLVDRELKNNKSKILTEGQRIYREHGFFGIRGEAEEAFPTIFDYALPMLKKSIYSGLTYKNAFLNTLLEIMRVSEDTNIISRGGLEALHFMRRESEACIALGAASTVEGRDYLIKLNKEFSQRKISPGGSADLLATTILFYLIEERYSL